MTYLETLEPIVTDTIAPQAQALDREARFPRAAMTALGQAGLLGLVSAREVGGMGLGLREACAVVERIARDCPATAMVTTMHYAGTVLVERYGPEDVRRAIAAGQHVTTLAWSESGSRSHFWAPTSSARADGDDVVLDASKSMVTAAGETDSYVWSSRPVAAEGLSTLWLLDSHAAGLSIPQRFDGLGLRANASAPVRAEGVRLPAARRMGADGQGQAQMFEDELPVFVNLIASVSIGLMDGALARVVAHASGTRFAAGGALAELPTVRAHLAQARNRADQARALRDATLAALEAGSAEAPLRVLQVKACAADAALAVTETAMRVGGGAAFRKDIGIERLFRDARAAAVMAPTTDVLLDLTGRALCGLPLMG